jgi:hypothetical protein
VQVEGARAEHETSQTRSAEERVAEDRADGTFRHEASDIAGATHGFFPTRDEVVEPASKARPVKVLHCPGKPIRRIISLPSKAPRGRRGDIYMDEAAHHVNCRSVYVGFDGAHHALAGPAHDGVHAARQARHLLRDRHRGVAQVPALLAVVSR